MANEGEEQKLTFCQKFGNELANFKVFLYNPETKQVMGRSGKSWAKIGLFYFVFYGFLAGFFSAMLAVFMTTINQPEEGGPKLTQFIANRAGLTTKTNLRLLENFDSTDSVQKKDFVANAEQILEKYNNSDIYTGGVCDETNVEGIPKGGKPCYVDPELYGNCTGNRTFGFEEKKPCVFIRINKVYDWVPKNGGKKFLTLSCTCKQSAQAGCVAGIFPEGFLIAGFPFRGVKGHELPLVALQIDATKTGSDGRIDCELKGDDIKVASSFNTARSYGNIRIEGVYASN